MHFLILTTNIETCVCFLSFLLDGSPLKVGTTLTHLWFPLILDFLACNRHLIKARWVKVNKHQRSPQQTLQPQPCKSELQVQLTHLFFPRETSSGLYAQHYASSLIIIVCLSPKAAPSPGHVVGLKGPMMPAPTEPHEPKSSLLGSKITKSKESPASHCGNSAQGVAEHGRKSVKPQLITANHSKAPILLIRCHSTGNLDML